MTYDQQSQAREQRLRDRSRKPGESQASADTRSAASRTTPSHFVPFGVRQAMWEKEGYRGKAAKRMAQFQASTAGQAMGMGGTTDNPYGGFDTQSQSTGNSLAPDPVGGGGQTPFYVQPGPDSYKGVPNSSNDVHQKPTINPNLFRQQGQAQPQPGGFLNRLTGSASSGALGLVSKLSGVEDNSPQANFMRAKADGTLDASGITKAQKLARSMGTTFDPTTGYSRTPFMESTRGKSYDPTAETIEGKKSPSSPTLPAPTGDDVEASFQMPDGTMRTIRANESVEDGFKRARAPKAGESKEVKGSGDPSLMSQESASLKNPMLRDQPIESGTSKEPKKAKEPSKSEPSIPLYTGGGYAEEVMAKTAEDRKKPKPKTGVRFDPPEVVSETIETVSKNFNEAKETISETPDRFSKNAEEAKSSFNEASAKLREAPGIKWIADKLDASSSRRALVDLNRRLEFGKSKESGLTSADHKRYAKLAKEKGLKYSQSRGFYQ